MSEPLPFKPGDWVSNDADNIAKVKAVYRDGADVLLDLWLYTHKGDLVGRESPACGGPRTFEPCCDASFWQRIAEPNFPIRPTWVPNEDGSRTARMWAGERLPPARYIPKERKGRLPVFVPDNTLRRALEAIAKGHNDPRALAAETLGLANLKGPDQP